MTAEPYSDQDLKFIADHIPDSPQYVGGLDPDHERRRWLATLEAEREAREKAERQRDSKDADWLHATRQLVDCIATLEARLARAESAVRKLRGVLEEIGGGKPPGVTGKEFFVDRANRVLAEVHGSLAECSEPAPKGERENDAASARLGPDRRGIATRQTAGAGEKPQLALSPGPAQPAPQTEEP